jgi:hypothetical protein
LRACFLSAYPLEGGPTQANRWVEAIYVDDMSALKAVAGPRHPHPRPEGPAKAHTMSLRHLAPMV